MTEELVRYREFDPYPYVDRNDPEKRYTYIQADEISPKPVFKPRRGYEDHPPFYEEEFPYETHPAVFPEDS